MADYARMITLPSDPSLDFIDAALEMSDHDVLRLDSRLRRSSYEVIRTATVNGEPLSIELNDGTRFVPPPVLRIEYVREAG